MSTSYKSAISGKSTKQTKSSKAPQPVVVVPQEDLDQDFEESWSAETPVEPPKSVLIKEDDNLDQEFEDSSDNTNAKVLDAQVAQQVSDVVNDDNDITESDTSNVVSEQATVLETSKRFIQGEIILKNLNKDGYKVSGIEGDMVIGEWEDLLNENINKSHTKRIIAATQAYGFEVPRPIQTLSICRILRGGDLIAQAGAGNGKTGAFGIGILLSIKPELRAIQKMIIVPNSPLVDQIFEVLTALSRGTGIIIQRWRGGLPYPRDKRPHLVIGTPGRVVDMIKSRRRENSDIPTIDLSQMTSLILDEGDELLSLGFRVQLQHIVESCPETSQVCLFSATLPRQVLDICGSFMRDPSLLIVPEKKVITTRVGQWYSKCNDDDDKISNVIDCIKKNSLNTIMVFCNTCVGIKKLSESLAKLSQPIRHLCVNGKMLSAEREQVIKDFTSGSCRILLASDIVGRGFDFTDVSIVINYDMPNNIEAYIHRIGRAGRAGDIGNAVTLITTDEDMAKMRFIVQFHGMPIRETVNKKLTDGKQKNKFIFTTA
jgi:hypothetical protein